MGFFIVHNFDGHFFVSDFPGLWDSFFKSVVKGSNKSAWNPGRKSLINLIGKLSSPLHSFGFNFLAAFLISLAVIVMLEYPLK